MVIVIVFADLMYSNQVQEESEYKTPLQTNGRELSLAFSLSLV